MNPSAHRCHVLVIDDDPYILDVFKLIGESMVECEINTAINLRKAREIFTATPIDLVVLDLVFPEYDGYQVLAELKKHPHTTSAYYILMSAQKQDLLDRLRSYQLEAQDFIAKPFDIHEMELKLKSKVNYLKKVKPLLQEEQKSCYQVGAFYLDQGLRHILQAGLELKLTQMEYLLLEYLILNPATILTTQQIIDVVWRQKNDVYQITDLNVRALIHKVRNKIEPDPTQPIHLVNSRSNGYIFYPAVT